MGRPTSPEYWRRWRAAHPRYRERERERGRQRRQSGYRSPKTRRARTAVASVAVATHPLLVWAQEHADRLVKEDRRSCLSDELYPDVVGELLLARLEHRDPVKRATGWLRRERSWRHHIAPLLEVG
jgi:hypothetical protein